MIAFGLIVKLAAVCQTRLAASIKTHSLQIMFNIMRLCMPQKPTFAAHLH